MPEPNNIVKPVFQCVREGSPFLVVLLYTGACAIYRMHKENLSNESRENVELINYVLGVFDRRWKSASKLTPSSRKSFHQLTFRKGAYLKVLEAREVLHAR